MPSDRRPGRQGVYVELPPELIAQVRELAGRNLRDFRSEVQHALERHLAAPPTVRVVVDTPALPPAEVEGEGGAYAGEGDGVGHRRAAPERKRKARKAAE